MKLGLLFPPLGWLSALASAAVTAVWLQSGSGTNLDTAADLPDLGTVSPGRSAGLTLPTSQDEDVTVELFAARPLLAEGRRPFVFEPPAPEPIVEPQPPSEPEPALDAPPTEPTLNMLGTIERDGTRRVLMKDLVSGDEAWFGVGDAVGGWSIVKIQPESVTLQLQSAEITFNMFQEPIP
jgi:hypothetical protein